MVVIQKIMKNKCEEKFTHLFYLYESWCGSSGGQTGRTFADKFYTGRVSHLNGQRRSRRSPKDVGAQRGPQGPLPSSQRSQAFPATPATSASPSDFPQAQHEPPGPAHNPRRPASGLGNNYSLTTDVQLLTKVSAVSKTEKENHTLQMEF